MKALIYAALLASALAAPPRLERLFQNGQLRGCKHNVIRL
jgi:hypothetical protein